jgi:hypothetical protein
LKTGGTVAIQICVSDGWDFVKKTDETYIMVDENGLREKVKGGREM